MPILIEVPKKKPKQSDCTYFWREEHGEYFLDINKLESVHIRERHGRWVATAKLKGRTFTGTRPTLEEVFKAVDRVFYKEYNDYWVKTDVKAVLAPWVGDLNFGE